MHVSKPPAEKTMPRRFLDALVEAGKENNAEVELVHTKINLADERRQWQHERFSIKRVSLNLFLFSNPLIIQGIVQVLLYYCTSSFLKS